MKALATLARASPEIVLSTPRGAVRNRPAAACGGGTGTDGRARPSVPDPGSRSPGGDEGLFVAGNRNFPIPGNSKLHTRQIGGYGATSHAVGGANGGGAGGRCTDGRRGCCCGIIWNGACRRQSCRGASRSVAGRSRAGLRPATWTAIWRLAGRGTRRGRGGRTSWTRTRGSSRPG